MWDVRIEKSARQDFQSLPDFIQDETLELMRDLAEDPFPPEALQLRHYQNLYRIAVGGGRNRIVYRIHDRQRLVAIQRINERGGVYRDLDRW